MKRRFRDPLRTNSEDLDHIVMTQEDFDKALSNQLAKATPEFTRLELEFFSMGTSKERFKARKYLAIQAFLGELQNKERP